MEDSLLVPRAIRWPFRLVEQGGYPPLAFGFSGGWFYIKANSDRKWLTNNNQFKSPKKHRS